MISQDIKEKWIAALRSGEYIQGYNALRNPNNSFCCLGVLCDVSTPNMWKKQYKTNLWSFGSTEYLGCIPENHINKLILMNDREQNSFMEIAEYIEKNL